MSVDLHCHSYISDGALAPAQVVRRAAANGCTLLALTDHDHTGGLNEARSAAQEAGIGFVNGVEISVSWRGRSLHLVGLDFDADNVELQSGLARIRSGRRTRLEAMAAKFARKGITGVAEGALAEAVNPEMVGRTHIARFLVKQGHVRNMGQAFAKWLGEGKAAYVRHEWAPLEEAVGWIVGAGGLAVIAHPARYEMSATARRNLFSEFKAMGGHALEAGAGSHSANDVLNYALLAQKFDLLVSAGSDFHADGAFGGAPLGCPPALPAQPEPIWRLFRGSGAAAG